MINHIVSFILTAIKANLILKKKIGFLAYFASIAYDFSVDKMGVWKMVV